MMCAKGLICFWLAIGAGDGASAEGRAVAAERADAGSEVRNAAVDRVDRADRVDRMGAASGPAAAPADPAAGPKAPAKATKETPLKKPKSRTLQELIDFTLKEGMDKPLKKVIARTLGFERQMLAKTIAYTKRPDGYDRMFLVLLDKSGEGPPKPIALVIDSTKRTLRGSVEIFDSRTFRLDLHGRVETAAMGGAEGKKFWLNPVPLDSKIKRLFRSELDFLLKDAVGLEVYKWR